MQILLDRVLLECSNVEHFLHFVLKDLEYQEVTGYGPTDKAGV